MGERWWIEDAAINNFTNERCWALCCLPSREWSNNNNNKKRSKPSTKTCLKLRLGRKKIPEMEKPKRKNGIFLREGLRKRHKSCLELEISVKSGPFFLAKSRKQSQSLLFFNYLKALLMCCWAVATAFPRVCLLNNEALRTWDEFFMISGDHWAEAIGGVLFLILQVFTNRTELGILGHEVQKIRGGERWNWRRGGGDEAKREGSASPSVSEIKHGIFLLKSPFTDREKSGFSLRV